MFGISSFYHSQENLVFLLISVPGFGRTPKTKTQQKADNSTNCVGG